MFGSTGRKVGGKVFAILVKGKLLVKLRKDASTPWLNPARVTLRPRPRSAKSRRSEMPTPIDRDEVQRLLDNGAQLVEVLPEAEYEDEHLPGAISIPLKTLDTETAQRLERERAVIVYCYDYQ